MKPAQTVEYTMDDGRKAFALVLAEKDNGALDLIYLNPDNDTWHKAPDAPADRTE